MLQAVLARIQAVAEQGDAPCVVFGVDGVLCDNRPRTVQVLRELAAELRENDPEVAQALSGLAASEVRYDLAETLREHGLSAGDILQDAQRFWAERFYTDAYCAYDEPMPGAVEYVRACFEAGARIVYLTTRDAPGMLLGTVASLRKLGFPIALPGVELALKPDAHMSNHAFHHGFMPALHRTGEVLAFFDNTAGACNSAREHYPNAEVVLLEVFPAPEPPSPAPTVQLVADLRTG